MFGIKIITEKKLNKIKEQYYIKGYNTCRQTQQAIVTKLILNSLFGAVASKKPTERKTKCQKK